MSGRGSSHPDSETMDITPPSDEQPRYRLPPNPPVGSDEFLYLHAETITKVIELKAKLLADWFRPQGLDPESTDKLDQEYDATTAEMLALCEGLGMTHGELPNDILALHEKMKPIHLRLHEETTPSHAIQQKPPPTQKGKRPLDAEGYHIPPKHLVCKNSAGKHKDLAPLPTGNPFSLPANTPPPSNDPAESTTEKTRKLRIPPYFVRPTPNWIINMSILKKDFPSITAVNTHNSVPPQVNHLNSAPPQGSNNNAAQILSDAALHLFKILSKFAHDDSLHFPSLLSAIRSALPTLRLTQDDNENAIIIFEHYYAHYCSSR
ncbi:hypothetical protein CDAR_282211 [Caerostris darwini]|uniref:Uncharacterized protein n=1 Tax=Caerostris darwini TaxID=1538125 RepID=A0AAV4WSB7_9ARAC|nr:hypothetical protein CDAR_282211 [Caerostris darwini]